MLAPDECDSTNSVTSVVFPSLPKATIVPFDRFLRNAAFCMTDVELRAAGCCNTIIAACSSVLQLRQYPPKQRRKSSAAVERSARVRTNHNYNHAPISANDLLLYRHEDKENSHNRYAASEIPNSLSHLIPKKRNGSRPWRYISYSFFAILKATYLHYSCLFFANNVLLRRPFRNRELPRPTGRGCRFGAHSHACAELDAYEQRSQ